MLEVKKSQIPKAGQGLYATEDIKKDEVVCEYEGERLTWKECQKRNEAQTSKGAYYFYINSRNCIDAQNVPSALGRYANDAAGPTRIPGLRNNCKYEIVKNRVFIKATRNIKAGMEIFVPYGKEYWQAMMED